MSLQESRLPSDLSWSCRELRAVVRQTQIEVKTQCTTIFQSPRFYQGSNVCSSVTFTSLQVAKRAAEQERTLNSCQDMRTAELFALLLCASANCKPMVQKIICPV